MTIEGVPMYQIDTPDTWITGTTTVSRYELEGSSTGRVLSLVGEITYHRVNGLRLQILDSESSLEITLLQNPDEGVDRPWSFIGFDGRPYIWRMLFQSPVLFLNDNSQTPLARYRRAKLGIVSRSRRAFLEIFPAGINITDFIVVTFVTFSKQRMVEEVENIPSSPI
ncbi:hypothetical protein SERLA73DRAFT_138000 [Serpula lacrymans var. lacrymans S7.3]|uniref:DUF6593 domain-containing protein n=2 Tax=Serpula lacrymans var. lacrymans TaxID=341189 RepID=F8Q0N6_SERL3|nr:uncharacterized protein SERLADRAFT_391404 [Serpula lacrymans var. lacrymans S7.9]EGN97865.1 hypothetical protein SERLA73DRAFT_138000 [Serpula lacrymans var. lacrymans S7.3]EGO23448.1 hypothetical protein SERLADRAFT_391404 [Serpula lacrymans var. lacrymans S7.9]